MAPVNQSAVIEGWIHRLKAGDEQAREELLNCSCERLTTLTRKMLKDFGRVKRWEQTDDVVQNSLLRLYRTLAEVQPANAVEFYRLAALNIRRELLDLAKHYFGPLGLGANYTSVDMASDQTLTDGRRRCRWRPWMIPVNWRRGPRFMTRSNAFPTMRRKFLTCSGIRSFLRPRPPNCCTSPSEP